ncbi:MAG: hypothetical protein ACI9VR_000279 [Cognaticolwellia sp.]|jgi:hypothetical protein
MATSHKLTWELHTRADITAAWASLSDTDRFNRLAGLGFRFEPAPIGSKVRRIGRMRRLGMNLSWDELPFTYEAPRWFKTKRLFHGGPASEFSATLQLKEAADGGTDVRYVVEVVPKNVLTSPLVKIDLERTTRPQLDRVWKMLIADLDASQAPRDLPAPELSPDQEKVLGRLLGKLPQDEITEKLASFVRTAPLRDQDHMAPPTLATRWGMDEWPLTERLLQATELGLLKLNWEILCPSCRSPQAKAGLGQQEQHCPSCEIPFDDALPDSIVVSFRPSKTVRDFEVAQDCVGSPALTRHILASRSLMPGEHLKMNMNLAPGPYRLRTWPSRGSASLEVRPGPASSLQVQVGKDKMTPPLLRAEPGDVSIELQNTTEEPIRVVLESSWRATGELTAGRLVEHLPRSAGLLPMGLPVAVAQSTRRTVLAVLRVGKSDLQALSHYLKAAGAERVLLSRSGAALAVFEESESALNALQAMPSPKELRAGLSEGVLIELGEGANRKPTGSTAQAAMAGARAVAAGHVALRSEEQSLTERLSECSLESISPWYAERKAPAYSWFKLK